MLIGRVRSEMKSVLETSDCDIPDMSTDLVAVAKHRMKFLIQNSVSQNNETTQRINPTITACVYKIIISYNLSVCWRSLEVGRHAA